MDPFSITTGVIGLISSIASLSLRLNELRGDFVEATADIDAFTKELEAFSLVLSKLQSTSLVLPSSNMLNDLGKILGDCNNVLVSAETHLETEAKRSMRRMHWAFSGRKKYDSICRGLESYKSTISIAILLSTIPRVEHREAEGRLEDLEHERFLHDASSYGETVRGTIITSEDVEWSGDEPVSGPSHAQTLPPSEQVGGVLTPVPPQMGHVLQPTSFQYPSEARVQHVLDNSKALSVTASPLPTVKSKANLKKPPPHKGFNVRRTPPTASLHVTGSQKHQPELLTPPPTSEGSFPKRFMSLRRSTSVDRRRPGKRGLSEGTTNVGPQPISGSDNLSFQGKMPQTGDAAGLTRGIQTRPSVASQIKSFDGHSNCITTLTFSADGSMLVSISSISRQTSTIILWDMQSGAQLNKFDSNRKEIHSAAFLPDGERLVTVAENPLTLEIWDTRSGKLCGNLVDMRGEIVPSPFSPDGKMFASIVTSGRSNWRSLITVWDTTTLKVVSRPIQTHSSYVDVIAFSPDGKSLACGLSYRSIALYDIKSGEGLVTLELSADRNLSIVFSGNGELLASAPDSGIIRLWNSRSGALLNTIKCQGCWAGTLALSPDGNIIAAGGDDVNKISLWHVQSGTRMKRIRLFSNFVHRLAFSPDGRTLVAGGMSGEVKLWEY